MGTFYTYMWLREDGTPYYVGKGKGVRAFRRGAPYRERIITQDWLTEEQAFAAEKFLIAYYGRKDNGTGILRNLSDGGEGLSNPSEEVRAKQGATNKGRAWSESFCRKVSAAKKGKPTGTDYEKVADTLRKYNEDHPEVRSRCVAAMAESHKGKAVAQSTRDKIAASLRGKAPWNKGKKREEI